jgi:hypothetical protein
VSKGKRIGGMGVFLRGQGLEYVMTLSSTMSLEWFGECDSRIFAKCVLEFSSFAITFRDHLTIVSLPVIWTTFYLAYRPSRKCEVGQ